jgi:guanylate kinase
MPPASPPLIFVISGPSGSGKSTLVEKILELPGTLFSISCTTRQPRATESPGKWYDFISESQFERMVQQGEFLEYARVFGKHWYGTPKKWLAIAREKGLDLVLEIDVQGAAQLRAKHLKHELPELLSIFIVPPSRQELERRIRARGQDSEEDIARRLERARQEMQHYADYDYIVVNDDVGRAGHAVQAIVAAARCRRGQSERQVREILDSFGG